MATQAENQVDYSILAAGGWSPDLRAQIVERGGASVDELAANQW